MAITESIHLVLAAGNGCEVWHPVLGEMEALAAGKWGVITDPVLPNNDPTGIKIIRKPFSALVAEVEADAVDNSAVRGLASCYPPGIDLEFRGIARPKQIKVMANEALFLRIYPDFETKFDALRGYHYRVFRSLLADGYAAGLPGEHWISREEMEGGENG